MKIINKKLKSEFCFVRETNKIFKMKTKNLHHHNLQISIKDEILILHFHGKKEEMNNMLDNISNSYEGVMKNRDGHNFPIDFVPKNHFLYNYKRETSCKYVIAIYNTKSLQHELMHAKFYLDPVYKQQIIDEWNNMEEKKRNYLTQFIRKMGYSDHVIVDEYQAYKYTEPANFFGIRL